jgi:hypothetical protein
MAAVRLSRLQTRILRWLAADEQRTRGMITSSPTTTSLFDIKVTTRYVSPAYPREQQEAAYVTSQSDRW